MNFSIINLGCKVNRVESDTFTAAFLARKNNLTEPDEAQVVIVNTCTVTGEAEKKTRKAVRRALRLAPLAQVVVTGCAVAIDPDAYTSLDSRVSVVAKGELLSLIQAGTWDDSTTNYYEHFHSSLLAVGEPFRTRVGVKVQDGCNNACTFCIVHIARGPAVSRSADSIIQECISLCEAGVKEIVLTGINLGSYDDHSSREKSPVLLHDLLSRILDKTAAIQKDDMPTRYRLSSIEPCDITDELIELLANSSGRICRHLHLPLQSGSAKILKEMARPYTAQQYFDLVKKLYERIPQLALSSDIIVGFPGETDEDFDQTLAAVRRCRFVKVHVFPYSRREGTPAALRADQIDPPIKTKRAQVLRQATHTIREQERKKRAGTRELALIEESNVATSESYYELKAPQSATVGSLVEVTLV